MKILVTGGAGFIGSHLCEQLLDNNEVVNVDSFSDFYDVNIKIKNVLSSVSLNENGFEGTKEEKVDKLIRILKPLENYSLEYVDITDIVRLERVFQKNDFDCIIHLAAMAGVRPSIEDPDIYYNVNVNGTRNILELSRKFGVNKVIIASSSSVYGNNKKTPFSETDNVDFPISPYAATKKCCEVMSHTYHHLYNLDIILLRFFTVYGPGQRPDLAIHKFTKKIFNGESIPFFGDGESRRDYTYIDDIVNGIVGSIEYIKENENVFDILNLGNNRTISLNEMVNEIEIKTGKKANKKRLPEQPGDVKQTWADISKAQRLIGYSPETSFSDGIRNFIKWYKED